MDSLLWTASLETGEGWRLQLKRKMSEKSKEPVIFDFRPNMRNTTVIAAKKDRRVHLQEIIEQPRIAAKMFERKSHFPNDLKKNLTKYVETRDFSRKEAEKLLRFIAYMYRLGAMKQPQARIRIW